MPLRCLLVDDNEAFLEAASVLLEREGLTVVGMASSIAEALRQARALRPDLILVDIGLGDESGFDLARLLAQAGRADGADVILISSAPKQTIPSSSPKARQPDSCRSRSYRCGASAGSSAPCCKSCANTAVQAFRPASQAAASGPRERLSMLSAIPVTSNRQVCRRLTAVAVAVGALLLAGT